MMKHLLIPLFLAGCASTNHKPVAAITDKDVRLEKAVRFAWSERAFTTSRTMVKDCLSQQWVERFRADRGRLPVIKVMPTPLQASGSIDPLLLEKMVEMELINSRRARVISAAEFSTNVDREAPSTLAVPKGSLRPDFVLMVGVAGVGRSQTVVLTTLQLVNVKTNEKIWAGVHRSRCG